MRWRVATQSVSYVQMGFIIAVFSLVTDHRGLPRTIARANNFARAITSYAGALGALFVRPYLHFFFPPVNSGTNRRSTHAGK